MLRFVVGSDEPPDLAFLAPDAPSWTHDDAVILHLDGERFVLDDAGVPILSGSATSSPFALEVEVGDAEVLGFGAATGAPNRNDARFRVMTRDTQLYGIAGASYTACPFFVARWDSRTVGVLIATTYPLDVAVTGGKVSLAAACDTDGTPVDVVVFRGSPVEIARDLAAVTGRSFLPPAWALGFHQSRWSYRTQEEVLTVARRFRALGLSADVIHLDIHYMDRYRVFTFSPTRFPSPRRMHDELETLGFRTLAIVDPGVSVAPYPVHDAFRREAMLLERSDGEPFVGKVWPGATVFPDFTQARVREAWGRSHETLVAAGVSGVWNDMNDPVLRIASTADPLEEDVLHHGVPHRRVRNLYANGMAEAAASGLSALRPGRRPFVLSRSGFLGIQRHAAVWTGDNHSSWKHLRENLHMVVNLGLSGVPITGADVGGFARGAGKYGAVKPLRPRAELFVRWMELGALMPFFRVHCTLCAPRQEPWSFGRQALELSRRVLCRRYRLLPLLYRLALEAHVEGVPIVRPLFMHYDVPKGRGDGQFLLGDAMLAAPVLHAGVTRREVWLPEGRWVNWHTAEVHDGDQAITTPAPLGTTPMFVRAGAALFVAEPGRNAGETLRAPLALEITVPPPGTIGRGSLFLDDGDSDAAARFVLDVEVEEVDGRLRVRFERTVGQFEPVQRDLELRAPPGYAAAVVDGVRRELARRELAGEDRSAVLGVTRVPLDAGEVWVER
jgi:alpha-glucosidase